MNLQICSQEGCQRWIPKSIGKTCRTCQKKSQGTKIGTCFTCKSKESLVGKKKNTNQEYRQNCFNNIPWCAYCKKSKCWGKNNGGSKFTSKLKGGQGLFFHSMDCANKWEQEQQSGPKGPPKLNLGQIRQKYLQELTGLKGWGLLTEDEKDKFKEMITKGFFEFQFQNAVLQAKNLISAKGGDKNDDDCNNLQAEIQKAMAEIESELNKEPKITEKKSPNSQPGISWRNYIKNSADLDELKIRKTKILDNIRAARQQKVLNDAIQQIKNALAQEPPIANNELSNPNWETEINTFSEENQIKGLRDKILGEITQKREKKEVESKLDELISQAQTAVKNNDLASLEKLLIKIEAYQGTKSYQDRKFSIEKLAQHLATSDLPKYQELAINSLNDFLQQEPPLTLDELEQATKNFAEQIKNAGSAEEIQIIKNSVTNNINQERSNKIVVNLINQAKQAKTEEEKSAVRQKISELENSDSQWIKDALAAKKSELEQVVNSWNIAEKLNNNINSPSSDEGKPGSKLSLIIFLAVAISGIIICGLLIIRRRRRY